MELTTPSICRVVTRVSSARCCRHIRTPVPVWAGRQGLVMGGGKRLVGAVPVAGWRTRPSGNGLPSTAKCCRSVAGSPQPSCRSIGPLPSSCSVAEGSAWPERVAVRQGFDPGGAGIGRPQPRQPVTLRIGLSDEVGRADPWIPTHQRMGARARHGDGLDGDPGRRGLPRHTRIRCPRRAQPGPDRPGTGPRCLRRGEPLGSALLNEVHISGTPTATGRSLNEDHVQVAAGRVRHVVVGVVEEVARAICCISPRHGVAGRDRFTWLHLAA
jgi:hypothetical protein